MIVYEECENQSETRGEKRNEKPDFTKVKNQNSQK